MVPLYSGTNMIRSDLDLLFRITQALLTDSRELEPTLRRVLQRLAEFGMQRGTIALLDEHAGEVRIEASHGLSARQEERGRYRVGEGVVGNVMRRGEPAVVARVGSEPLFLDKTGARKGLDQDEITFVCVPIKTKTGNTIGTLSVDRIGGSDSDGSDTGGPESDGPESGGSAQDDLRLLTIIAAIMGEAINTWREHRDEVEALKAEKTRLERQSGGRAPANIIGSSRQMQDVYQLIAQVAGSDATVLVRGESGTGKELVARAIHDKSRRANGPFVSVNCGALPENLVESELFGHVRGAYTGASTNRRGRFEMAHRGTIFLDEIADLPHSMQVKMLRALQEGEIHRVGDERPQKIDVRIVAATNLDLESMLSQGTFREDLYYRLNIFPIYMPALRERKSDITQLADHFAEKYSASHGRSVVRISTPAIELMCEYHWPGNVRELENCIARAVLLSDDGSIRSHHLPPTLQTGRSSGTTQGGSLEQQMMAYEREILIEAMKDAGGILASAARALQTTPRILAYRLKKHELHGKLVRARRHSAAY